MNARAQSDFAERYGRWGIVVGASEGVGACVAAELAARGLDLLLLARKRAAAQAFTARTSPPAT